MVAGRWSTSSTAADAVTCLQKVARSGWRKEWIKHDPDLTALRGLREFAALVS